VSFRTTGALLAVLAVLAGVVYYVMRQPSPDDAAAIAKTPPVVTFTAADATKLTVSATGKTTELDRAATSWTIVKPEPGPAETAQVEGWVDQMSNLTADRVIDDASDLTTYGLAQPKFNVQIDLKTGSSVKLQFGDKTPDGADYYVRVPDDATKAKSVFLVGSSLGDDLNGALTKPPKALPTPTPLPTLVPVTITPPPTTTGSTPTATPGG
jgi:ABC-type uncharacterized transport system auxiliary subunit